MRLILILISGMLLVCAAGCGGGSAASPAKETVVASFYPLAYAAEEVGNGAVDVENLTPAGAVWLDPLRYAKIVGRIGQALHEPEAATRLQARLRDLDGEYRTGLAHCERHEIVTSHEAFGYLAERYGLEQVAITGLSPEVEPEPAKLQHVVELVRQRGVTTIYFETWCR